MEAGDYRLTIIITTIILTIIMAEIMIMSMTMMNMKIMNENGEYGKAIWRDIEQIRNSKIVGIYFPLTFFKNDCIFIVDQHAAHERIMFED